MSLLLFLVTSIFIFIAFFSKLTYSSGTNPFFMFVANELHVVFTYFFIFLVAFMAVSLYLSYSYKTHKHYPFYKKYLFSLFHSSILLICGFFLSYIFLLLIACIQLNFFSVLIRINPKLLGVVTDRETIVRQIKTSPIPLEISSSDKEQKRILFAIGEATSGTENVYGKFLLPSISRFFLLPIHKPEGGMLLVDNILIFTELNQKDIQEVSPYLAYTFARQYFQNRYIKYYPKTYIMTRAQYLEFRKNDGKNKLAKVEEQIKISEDSISTFSAQLDTDKEALTQTQETLKKDYAQREDRYKACYSAGSYKNKVFTRLNTDDYCKTIYNSFDDQIKNTNDLIETLKNKIQTGQQKLSDAQKFALFFKTQRNVVKIQSNNIPHELGVFTPDNTIEIALDTSNSHAIADYFETLIHEYYHYASYSKEKHFTDLFFEEALTEYFARKTVENSLNFSTNLGYPVHVKLMSEIVKSIPESDLANVYFTKDEARLEELFNRVYGNNFYKDTRTLFATLQFTSDPKQILSLANRIMKKIGSPPLKESDIFSAYSNY